MIEHLEENLWSQQREVNIQTSTPRGEHLQLCLQLVLQSHLHQLDAGITDLKLLTLCEEIGMRNIPEKYEARLAALQNIAARLLPTSN